MIKIYGMPTCPYCDLFMSRSKGGRMNLNI